jgi:hypothetical protein
MGAIALVAVLNGNISASLAGFALAFANTITGDLLFVVRSQWCCNLPMLSLP